MAYHLKLARLPIPHGELVLASASSAAHKHNGQVLAKNLCSTADVWRVYVVLRRYRLERCRYCFGMTLACTQRPEMYVVRCLIRSVLV